MIMQKAAVGAVLMLLCGLTVLCPAGAQEATVGKIANNSTIVINGYNATGS